MIVQSCTVELKIGPVHFVLCPVEFESESQRDRYLRFLSHHGIYPAVLLKKESEGKFISLGAHLFPESHRADPLSWEAPIWEFDFRSQKLPAIKN